MTPRSDLLPLLCVALRAAHGASSAILQVYGSDFSVERKSDKSPLTLADRESHRVITAALEHTGFSVLSEEGQDIPHETRRAWQRFWLVDPLDGTKEFVKRNGEFTVNIALVEESMPVLGVVAVPVRDTAYFGAQGLGAFRLQGLSRLQEHRGTDDLLSQGERLPVHGKDSTGGIVVAGSRSHGSALFNDLIARLEADKREVRLIPAGSALKFCLVAEGAADLYPRFGPTMEWDTAAGQVVVEEAGGEVVRFDTRERLGYNKPDLRNPHFLALGPGAPEGLW